VVKPVSVLIMSQIFSIFGKRHRRGKVDREGISVKEITERLVKNTYNQKLL
jgi:hypothetical protein